MTGKLIQIGIQRLFKNLGVVNIYSSGMMKPLIEDELFETTYQNISNNIDKADDYRYEIKFYTRENIL